MPQIRTLCRIKPTAEYYPEFEVSRNTLHLRVPEVLRDFNTPGAKPRANISHEFHFDYIFKNTATQEEVFDVSAKEIIEAFLGGYNGTIFAYGQTGTGKTYTVEGSAKQYKQRGLEPRALAMIYKELEKRTEEEVSVHLSYLEIYQEVGYDLLNPGARTQSPVTPFPKVSVLEGSAGVWMVRNLSVHYAASEDVAQNLLLQGQANRRVAATTVHDRSSRSHAVFTIQLSTKKPDSDVVVKSKLHLVDLAGSERVSKTGVEGHQLNEAKCINLSLHYLETVIIALQGDSSSGSGRPRQRSAGHYRGAHSRDTGRPSSADPSTRASRHVPYRNSLLTMVLRDSLGGNCMTCMIATISLEFPNLGETISTCRFAGRVACIANSVKRNETIDEKSLIKKLRRRVAELETELSCLLMAKEETSMFSKELMNAKLTDEDKIHCNKIVKSYIDGKLADPVSAGITNPYKFRECLKILKKMVLDGYFNTADIEDMNKSLGIDTDQRENLDNQLRNSYHEATARQFAGQNTTKDNTGQDHHVKSHAEDRRNRYNQEKVVEIPITNAWGENACDQSELEQPVRRPRNRQRIRRSTEDQLITEETSDEEGRKLTEHRDGEGEKKRYKEFRLSAMLTAQRSRRKYPSPFEKRRIKDIKRLNTRVEALQKDQIVKEEELVKMKIDLAAQELDLMEEQIRTKLNVTDEQLNDQRAYVQQLKSTEADHELIQKETLVEKQLRKKQAKANKKLEAIDDKRKQLNQHSEEVEAEFAQVEPTIKEQYGKYRKKDGSLNTRQVFDMLKSEEKKQEKIQSQIEQERMMMLSQHLEMKEAATRQKLREFKEMLRMSHSAGFPEGHMGVGIDPRSNTAPANDEQLVNKARVEEVGLEDVERRDQTNSPVRTLYTRDSHTTHLHKDSSRIHYTRESKSSQPLEESIPERVSNTRDTRSTHLQEDDNNVEIRPMSRQSMQSVRSVRSVIPDSDFYAKRKQEKDPTLQWEQPYSRPTTACSNNQPNFVYMSPKTPVQQDQEEEDVDNMGFGLTDDLKSTQASRKSLRMEPEHDFDEQDDMDTYETMMPSEYVYGMGSGDKFDGRRMGLASMTFDAALASMLENPDRHVYYDYDEYDQYARTNQSTSPQSRHVSRYDSDNFHDRTNDIRRIYGVPKSPERKSGGKSREPQIFSDEEIRQTSKSPEKPSRDRSLDEWERRLLMSDRKTRKDSPRKSVRRTNNPETGSKKQDPDHKYANWGPQTKHAPIASRLVGISLQTPEPKSSRNSGKSRHTEYSFGISDDNTYRQKNKNDLLFEEPKFSSVTAVPEDEAESSFMGKVQVQKDRVSKIRKARKSAEVIQRAWRKYQARKQKRW